MRDLVVQTRRAVGSQGGLEARKDLVGFLYSTTFLPGDFPLGAVTMLLILQQSGIPFTLACCPPLTRRGSESEDPVARGPAPTQTPPHISVKRYSNIHMHVFTEAPFPMAKVWDSMCANMDERTHTQCGPSAWRNIIQQ